nr:MAG TPA: hypothetical protein [Crassvirales sp.]
MIGYQKTLRFITATSIMLGMITQVFLIDLNCMERSLQNFLMVV